MPSPRLKTKYLEEIAPALQQEFNYSSPMATPKLVCIKLNIGMGAASSNARLMDAAVEELTAIAGQRPVVTKARKSIAQFKLREGMAIGCTVTFDGRGNYTLGVREHTIFPEIDYTKTENVKGMNVTIVTTAKKDGEALSMLTRFGMPFRK